MLNRFLKKVADFQFNHKHMIILFVLFFTIFMTIGATKIGFQGDITKEMPQDLPIYKLNDKITDKFSGQDTMFVLVKINDDTESNTGVNDIREPEIMEYVVELENSLLKESVVDGVTSIAPLISALQEYSPSLTKDMIISAIDANPDVSALLNRDYKMTAIIVTSDVGQGEDKIKALTRLLEDKIDSLSRPAGVEVIVTGTPSVILMILDLLKHDSGYTLVLASLIILLVLFVMQRAFTKGMLIFIPILLGIVWTMGTMGWLNLKISAATAGLGAMLLGLGVEYGVFMLSRYKEERDKNKKQLDSLRVSVPAVGSAILGSGTTTIVGFLALTLSIMPMLQKLGLSLALGIFYCIIAAVLVEPVLILYEENFEFWFVRNISRHYRKKREVHKTNGK